MNGGVIRIENLIGKSIGRYHILEQLGQGGMATVYKAFDTRLEREVAVKVIRREAFSQEILGRVLKRFEREAKTLAKLTHPNIVSIIYYGDHEGSPYLVMPYLQGGTLKQLLVTAMPWQEAIRLLLPILSALAYAHKQGVIHRDIKPANILITASGEPMLTDFGIAKILELNEGQTLTGTGLGVGTPEYMPPEQGLGKEIDQRADIYALGVVFYELITGTKPYSADTPMAVIFKHISDPLPRPRKIIPDIPDKVERVVFKALAKKPEDRYADMTAFSTAIEKLVQVNSVPSWDQKHRLDSIVKSTVGESLPETRDDLQSFIPAPATQNQKNTKRPLTNQIKKNLPKPINEKSKVVSYGLAIIFVILFGISIFLNKSNLSQIKKMGLFIRTENSMDPNATLKLTSDGQNPIAVIQSTNTSMKPTETSDELKQINTLEMTITSSVAPLITETIAPTISPTVDLEYLASLRIGSKKISEIDGMSQVFVPAGTFIMGSNDYLDKRHYRAAESPEHEVYLDAFWIDKTELTNGKYRLCVDAGVCEPPRRLESNTREDYFLNPAYDEYPVISVEWSQAQTYCQWAGRTLPTEAEWEKAARGVSGSMRPFGKYDGNINYLSWYGDTTFVGKFLNELSPYGVLDMRGNVSEWVYDWYDPDYYKGKLSFQKWENPKGPDEPTLGHVIRGGSYSSEYERVQVTSRDSLYLHQNNNGFRCVEPVVFPKMLETEYQK